MKSQKITIVLEEIKNIRASSLSEILDVNDELEYLLNLQNEIDAYKPKIAVIGEFSSGKSTLINSFLGIDLLPAKFIPTTQYITNISYSEEEYIFFNNEKLLVSKENLLSIQEVKNEKIEIFLNNPILQTFSFIDTPGTNDPSKFSDEIVFSMIGEVDIVLFVFNSQVALKDTEKDFISKLVKKKDLEKFFFIFNKSDLIESPKSIKETSLNTLSDLLELDLDLLNKQSLVYSSSDVLKRKLHNEESQVFELFEEKLNKYIRANRTTLLNEWLESEVTKVIGSLLLKLDLLIDNINNDTEKYQEELNTFNKEIGDFELEIQKDISDLISKFYEIKQEFKRKIKDDIKFIKSDIETEVSNMSIDQLSGSRYIELRTKKLLEDKIEEEYKTFLDELGKLVSGFDKKVQESKINNYNIKIDTIKKSNKAKNIVNTTALMATGVGAVSVAPMATAAVATASTIAGFGAMAPTLALIPYAGTALAGIATISAAAVPIVGVVALAAGKVLFDVAKWGVGIVGSGVDIVAKKAQKKKYVLHIFKSLDDIQEQILSEIEKVNLDNFKENYIKEKFPKKVVLEEKIRLLETKYNSETQISHHKIDEIESIRNKLLQIVGEKNV